MIKPDFSSPMLTLKDESVGGREGGGANCKICSIKMLNVFNVLHFEVLHCKHLTLDDARSIIHISYILKYE